MGYECLIHWCWGAAGQDQIGDLPLTKAMQPLFINRLVGLFRGVETAFTGAFR